MLVNSMLDNKEYDFRGIAIAESEADLAYKAMLAHSTP
jgi:hypothetical protein